MSRMLRSELHGEQASATASDQLCYATASAGSTDDGIELGPLRDLAARPEITDIAVLPDGSVWADCGDGMQKMHVRIPFSSPQLVREYAIHLCAQLGVRLDDSSPIADACATSGLRMHAVLAPLVVGGASISIRIPPRENIDLDGLIARGFCSESVAQAIRDAVMKRSTIIISGGTGTGKTTLVRALLQMCPANERIISVEEVRELSGAHRENYVSLVSRPANSEGKGEVSLAQLVRATVRMRPDRIVLGECRGAEIADLLRAFNTGHRGGFVTIHADDIQHLALRLVALGQLAGLDPRTTSLLSCAAFDMAIHVERSKGKRRISQIGRLRLSPDGIVQAVPIWSEKTSEQYSSLSGYLAAANAIDPTAVKRRVTYENT